MRWPGCLVMAILLASLALPSAHAGPLREIVQSLPDESVPTNGGVLSDTVGVLENEIGRIAGDPNQPHEEQVRQAVEVLTEWAQRTAGQRGCTPQFDLQWGSEPVVPPRITTSHSDGYTTTTIDAGAVTLEVTTKDSCLGSQPQSQPVPDT